MKQLMDALRGARKIEILVIAVMLCVLLVLGMGGGRETGSAADSEEARLERILSQIDGAGKVTVMLWREDAGISGCVVTSSGAGDVRVMLELQRAVRALTGLELEQIEIIKSKG